MAQLKVVVKVMVTVINIITDTATDAVTCTVKVMSTLIISVTITNISFWTIISLLPASSKWCHKILLFFTCRTMSTRDTLMRATPICEVLNPIPPYILGVAARTGKISANPVAKREYVPYNIQVHIHFFNAKHTKNTVSSRRSSWCWQFVVGKEHLKRFSKSWYLNFILLLTTIVNCTEL